MTAESRNAEQKIEGEVNNPGAPLLNIGVTVGQSEECIRLPEAPCSCPTPSTGTEYPRIYSMGRLHSGSGYGQVFAPRAFATCHVAP